MMKFGILKKKSLKVLNLLNVNTTCYSFMIAALNNLPRSSLRFLVRELASITFRYNLSDLNPNEAERYLVKSLMISLIKILLMLKMQ